MHVSRCALLTLGIVLCAAWVSRPALAQSNADKPIDYKQFIVPVLPPLQAFPPNSQINPGVAGGSQTPYTTAPLYDSTPSSQPAPGLKLTIPTR